MFIFILPVLSCLSGASRGGEKLLILCFYGVIGKYHLVGGPRGRQSRVAWILEEFSEDLVLLCVLSKIGSVIPDWEEERPQLLLMMHRRSLYWVKGEGGREGKPGHWTEVTSDCFFNIACDYFRLTCSFDASEVLLSWKWKSLVVGFFLLDALIDCAQRMTYKYTTYS